MGRLIYVQNSLNGGVLSPYLDLRSDLESYTNRVRVAENMLALPYGGMRTRFGTQFINETKDNEAAILVPFEITTTSAFILEFGNLYIRVYQPTGRVLDASGAISNLSENSGLVQVTTSAPHGLTTNNRVSLTNVSDPPGLNTEWVITVIDASNFTLAGSSFQPGYVSGGNWGRPYEISTPYTAAHLPSIRWAQSGTSLYLVHPAIPPHRLNSTSLTNWTLTNMETGLIDGPYFDPNVLNDDDAPFTNITMTPTAATGSITLNTSSAVFEGTDVNRYVRMQTGTSWGHVRITSVLSSTQATATVLTTLTNISAKTVWRLGAFGQRPGYPSVVSIFQQRLVFASTSAQPQSMWFSAVGSFTDFSPSSTTGTLSASDGVTYRLGSGRVNAIRWLMSGQQLLIGTVGEEFSLRGANQEAISASNPPIVQLNSAEGCANLPAIRVGNQTVFVQRSGREVRSLQYDIATDNFLTTEASIAAEHYFRNTTIKWSVYQPRPHRTAYFVLNDGTIAAFTFYPIEKVQAWSRFTTDGVYVHAAVIPDSAGTSDQLWYVVQRTVNGISRHFIERENEALNTDSALMYTGPAITSVTAMDHLEAAHVKIVGDGAVFEDQTVTKGHATLQYGDTLGPAASTVEIGLPIPTPTITTVQPVPDDQSGSTRGRRKQWTKLWVSVVDTMGLTIAGTELPYRTPADKMDTAVPLFTGEKQVTVLGNDRVKTLTIQQYQPLSAHIRGYFGQLNVED